MLPSSWVERIFERLTIRYGTAFLNKWLGLDLAVVQADWAHELEGFVNYAPAIDYALKNLPERPPNVMEFRAIAQRAPATETPRIESPKADPSRIAAEIAKLKPLQAKAVRGAANTDWARAIVARAEAGDKSHSTLPLRWAREVLARESA